MAALPLSRIQDLLSPFVPAPLPEPVLSRLSVYLDLLLRWNARTNLTAVREPETIVTRHFGESVFGASFLPPYTSSILDLGSGAGFPGLPLQILRPGLPVTLAESQGKKAAFLREAIRALDLRTQVHSGRAEELPGSFGVVVLRAVDNMQAALGAARSLTEGPILAWIGAASLPPWAAASARHLIPGTEDRIIARIDVPRGTEARQTWPA